MSCVKLVVWPVVAQEVTNIIIFHILEYGVEYGAEYGAECGTESGAK